MDGRQGLHDVSFSRPKESLDWGNEVPNDTELCDVCPKLSPDALTNYYTALVSHDVRG